MNTTSTTQPTTALTLDAVLQEMQHWRKHKKTLGAALPDSLWLKLFELAKQYSPEKIRQIFSISKAQYETKYKKLTAHLFSSASTVNPVFCELPFTATPPAAQTAIPPLTIADVEQLKKPSPSASNYLDLTTIVVELYRSDGQRMKIHTTQTSFKALLTAFFESGHTA